MTSKENTVANRSDTRLILTMDPCKSDSLALIMFAKGKKGEVFGILLKLRKNIKKIWLQKINILNIYIGMKRGGGGGGVQKRSTL